MSVLIDKQIASIIKNERSEREILREQLNHWRRMKQNVCDSIAAIERRLAAIERDREA